ncbi:MAG: PKD domain-containing protein [Chitinophagaceae bacterium]|nr:PKD domain-containing protein [Chitinophagaceae bacterium]
MKKFITLVGLIFTVFFFKANAQTTCNAEFAFQFINGNTVTFTPAMTDSVLTQHIWNFGDASPVSNQVVPTHSYAANGTYSVVHTVVLRTPNGTPVCTQSFTRVIVIQQAPPCNLVVDFSWMPATANPLTIAFQNLSTPLAATDSVQWSFGDGSSSLDVNPMHTYTNAGSYTVCLRVKKLTTPGTTPCLREICKTVIVQTHCNMVANFIWHPDSLNAQKYCLQIQLFH